VKILPPVRWLSLSLACLFLVGCSGDDEGIPTLDQVADILNDPLGNLDVIDEVVDAQQVVVTESGIEDTQNRGLIVGVISGGVTGVYAVGSPPQTAGALVLDPVNSGQSVSIIAGGSTEVNLSAGSLFSVIYVLADTNGYYQISLPQAVQTASVLITYSGENIAAGDRRIDLLVADAVGAVSAPQPLPVQTVEVGTGDLQVSVSWDALTDVDLWLVQPDGTKIYFGNETSEQGGMLDLDSNAACFIDGVNNENITYDGVTAPAGEYVVSVSYFDPCEVATPTNYVVTIRANGSVSTYTGDLSVEDEVDEIARFIVR